MIKVTYGNNVSRMDDIVEPTTSLKDFCEAHEVDYAVGSMHLNGAPLLPGDINKTFADFGVTVSCYLLNVVKADNGFA